MYLKPRTHKIEVDVTNLMVGTRDWSFDYVMREDGLPGAQNHLSGIHYRSQKTMKRAFERGYAMELVFRDQF